LNSAELRGTLFGDLPIDHWPPGDASTSGYPWDAFADARTHIAAGAIDDAKGCWREIVGRPGLESRHYLQAWQFLREHGDRPAADAAKQVLGVVVEMASPEGLDVIAAYADGSARYYNHAGGGIVLEHPNRRIAELINDLIASASGVVARIGPFDGPRPGPPPPNYDRLSFLTPSGLHFGEGPIAALEADAVARPVLQGATAVLAELTAMPGLAPDG